MFRKTLVVVSAIFLYVTSNEEGLPKPHLQSKDSRFCSRVGVLTGLISTIAATLALGISWCSFTIQKQEVSAFNESTSAFLSVGGKPDYQQQIGPHSAAEVYAPVIHNSGTTPGTNITSTTTCSLVSEKPLYKGFTRTKTMQSLLPRKVFVVQNAAISTFLFLSFQIRRT